MEEDALVYSVFSVDRNEKHVMVAKTRTEREAFHVAYGLVKDSLSPRFRNGLPAEPNVMEGHVWVNGALLGVCKQAGIATRTIWMDAKPFLKKKRQEAQPV